MSHETTIDEAIRNGQRMVTYPSLGLMMAILAVSTWGLVSGTIAGPLALLGIFGAFAAAWLWWSIAIPRWKVEAFGQVRNVHALKKRAIQEKLIWPDASVWAKTEIWTAADRATWSDLQRKFEQEDEFHDDAAVPAETIIYYSRTKNLVEMGVMLACLGFGVMWLLVGREPVVGVLAVAAGAFFGYREYREATNTTPQIILNSKGMATVEVPFVPWPAISGEEAVVEGYGRYMRNYLVYTHPGGRVKLMIEDFDTDRRRLNALLALYRGRAEHPEA